MATKHVNSLWIEVTRHGRRQWLRAEMAIDIDKLLSAMARRAAKNKTGKVSMMKGMIKVGIVEVRDQ